MGCRFQVILDIDTGARGRGLPAALQESVQKVGLAGGLAASSSSSFFLGGGGGRGCVFLGNPGGFELVAWLGALDWWLRSSNPWCCRGHLGRHHASQPGAKPLKGS